MARPRHGVVVVTPKRRKQWTAIPGIVLTQAADATLLGASLAFGEGGNTVLRMRGEYTIVPGSTAPVAADRVKITLALGVISSDAFAAGAASVPDPAGEPEYPWLYWAEHTFEFGSNSLDPSSAGASLRQAFDVKSMRKFSPGQSLAWISQYTDLAGTPSVRVSFGQTRVLLALP